MNKFLIIVFLISISFGVNAQEKDAIVLLNPTDFKEKVENKDVQLIDVRTPEEFQESHIKEAINIDFYSEEFENEFNTLDKDQPIYLYCRSGNRSSQSALKLLDMGFKEIYDLDGGILKYNIKE